MNRTTRFPSLTGILAGILLATAPGAFGASITYAGVDTATKGNWRSTSVTKPQDISGDNAYGTDGYIAGEAQTAILNPAYATLAIIGGTQDGINSVYINVDKATDPISSTVADENAPARYHHPVANLSEHDSVRITLTSAKTFRVAVLADIRNDNAVFNSTGFRIRQTAGGGADSGMRTFTNNNSGGDWHFFDITGVAGDQFVLSLRASASAGETAFARLAIDSVVAYQGPVISTRIPPAGAVVTNLTEASVTFSEPVTGVDAADLLINGTPAFGLSGSGSNYTFSFAQPAFGTVAFTWANGHGIIDLATLTNAFKGAGAGWSVTLDNRTILVPSNSTWLFIKGLAEASSPIQAWRQPAFDDSGWSNAFAPFYFGDPYNTGLANSTLLSDMANTYSSVYLRKKFNVFGAASITNLFLNAQSDDGFIAWINGTEVLRYNMGAGDIPYNGFATTTAPEPNSAGAAYIINPLNAAGLLLEGENVLAIHAFNQSLTSSDFGFNAQLYGYLPDAAFVAPRVAGVSPPAGELFSFTNLTVQFTEPVGGVDAGDLLINGVPATAVSSTTNTTYAFGFPSPAFGPVTVSWAATPGIVDFDTVPKAFVGAGVTFQYTLRNPSAPTVAAQTPPANTTINNLTQITVNFSEPVTGVNAADLLMNGGPASTVQPVNASTYRFTFPQPPYGPVSVGWIAGHGIADLEVPPNVFDATRPASSWSYILIDQTPPAVLSQTPSAGSQVSNLTQITVTFTEAVSGVDAFDLLINGAPASTLQPFNASTYLFTFPQPNATLINVTWATAHGIRDLAPSPYSFNASAPESTWSHATFDTVPPTLAGVTPPPGATVRSLLQITVVFTEAVTGVGTNALLLNNQPARQVSGSGAGPYTFAYAPPSNGLASVQWSPSHAITDLATPPNAFTGGEWTYWVDPNASFADKIVISEIMFNPVGGREADEWIELHNVGADVVNLAGWRLTRGVDFTFPNVSIPGGGFLVVAADEAAFEAKYPGVGPVIGGWTGRLANNGETLELITALDEVVTSLRYAKEGDWARRERGHGAGLVESLTRSGDTATVNLFGHDFTANDRVLISGADQPQDNGIFVVSSPGSASFNIAVSGNPATPATGRIICRHIEDNGAAGWSWFSAADGFGSSLELVNPAASSAVGQNWLPSTLAEGTPGRTNSVLSTNMAPFLLDVRHFPAIPRSTEPVTISARVRDELSNGVQNVTLFYRDRSAANPPAFSSAPMLDNGASGDGAAGDGLYGATLSAQPHRTTIEFYVQAVDATGLIRNWPAPTWETNNTFAQLANALYQVDDETSSAHMPFMRVVMTETERAQLAGIDTASDAEMNATFLSVDGDGTKVRYGAGVRLRGAGSRSGTPKNYRVNVPTDNPWNDRTRMNFNSRYPHAQLAGSVLAQHAGLASADARVVQLRLNGQNLASSSIGFGCYVLVEPMNGDWAANHYPLDGDGDVYRGSKFPWNANLDYLGTNAATYQGQTGAGYYKASNRDENDWTDLFNLTYALSPNTADADYVNAVLAHVNVEEWMRYFVVCNFFDYMETSLCRGVGDDYAMYRGKLDPRFRLVAHDFDTILGQGDTSGSTTRSIWVMVDSPPSSDPALRANFLSRFMRHPDFAPIYYRVYQQLLNTTFAPENVHSLLDQMLGTWVTGNALPDMKNFAANRRAYVLGQIPTNLTVATTLATQSGYLFTANPSVTLNGQADVIQTRRVLVNGTVSTWSAWEGRWANTLTLQPGLNRVLVQALNSNQVEFARSTVEIWYDDSTVQNVAGTLATDTFWTAAAGPYNVTANLTVASGATLTVQPGTTVYLASGVNLAVANGGRLRAEGTETAPIRFTRAPGASTTWGGITIAGGPGSPETRIVHAHLEFNDSTAIHSTDGTVFLANLTFGNTGRQYVSLDRSWFVVQDCVFPATTASFEPVHGNGGIKAGGRGIFLRNFFGPITGYNDTIDFSGGQRPGPIVQVINNVFMGTGDDHLDLDNTDAWVEGNLFLHAHKNGSPDTASAISGGDDTGTPSDITILGNLIYDCDHAANAKQGNFYTLLHNTIVRQTHVGGLDTEGAVVVLADNGMTEGRGIYLEGNIIFDAEELTREQVNALVTFTNNLMNLPWTGPGGGNVAGDPLFKNVPALAETTNFTTWASAQVLWDWFSLRTGSPAAGAGPNGRDLGAALKSQISSLKSQRGVSISGEPFSPTPQTSATLTVGLNRTGSGILPSGWPDGSGFTHYRWRLDGGVWSAESPLNTPISLGGLSVGSHYVEVVGRNDAGLWQDDPVLGADAAVTLSRTWTVDPSASSLRLNEVLASNGGAVIHTNTTPDLIELFNASDEPVSLAGVRLTDDPAAPDKFIFPPGASLQGGSYLVLFANDPDGTPGYHLGFYLSAEGEGVYLYDAPERGGALLDSVVFGPQLTDLSIGRLPDSAWALTMPTFGGPNQAAPMGDPGQGAIHLNFGLSGDQGAIGLYQADLTVIDLVLYQAQRANVSQGRTPNGGSRIAFFAEPTPGAGNPLVSSAPPPLALPLVGMTNVWRYDQSGADLGTAWREPGYHATDWPSGAALLAVEDCGCLPYPIHTPLSLTNGGASVVTYYFRTQFVAPTNGAISALRISHVLDDGAVVYLNGQEVRRVNLPAGTVTAATLTSSSVGDATLAGPVEVPVDALVPGTNVLAVEVHQSSAGSSDVVFGLALDALVVTNTAASGAVLINEVLAVNHSLAEADGSTPDWVELMNLSAGRVALGGLGLTDDSLQPQRWVFPPEAEIAPGGYLRILCDGGRPASATNTGFGLKATGGSVYLFDAPANGGSLLSSVTYGIQLADFSIGREPDGSTNWFLCNPTPAVANQTVASLGDPANLKVNEWMADPGPGNDDWFEIYNPDPQPVALGGLHLTDDLNIRLRHRIAALSFLGTGTNAWQKFIADGNTGAGADHVNFALRAGGEAIGVFTTNGVLIDGVVFGAQTQGISEGRFPDGAASVVTFPATASPGAANYRWLTTVAISEALTRSTLPLEDAIELQNLTAQAIDLGGWWLSDDPGTLRKYQIPAPRILPPCGFTVIYEHQFTNRELAAIPFALSSQGDEIVLSAATNNALTGWRAKVDFGPAANAVSFGRYVTSDQREQFVAMSARTFGTDDPGSVDEFRTGTGQTNTYPRVGPVVISEIMYHPPDLGTNDNTRDEFIELRNITTAPVALSDGTNGWHLRDAVDFDFPLGTVLQPGDYLLVVGFDPVNNPAALAAFRTTYRLDPSVRLVGPWSGRLANDSEDVELRRPGDPDSNSVPYILVERVRYSDVAPWPAEADGTGYSLQRLADNEFANDPVNWVAATPTPGPQAAPVDSDGDGLPDTWENRYGLDPFNPNDAALDADGDGLTNLQEFQHGTDPRDPTSGLRLDIALAPDGTHVVLSFTAAAEFAYGLEYAETLGAPWQPLQDFPAASTNRLVQHTVPVSSPMRFYRLCLQASPSPAELRLNSVERTPGDQIRLTITVPAYRSCTVLFTPALSGSPWTHMTSYPAVSTNQVIQLETPASGASGFFRVRSANGL